MKHKKHWNSFSSAFFVPAARVLEQLRHAGCIRVDCEAAELLLKRPLRCHRCSTGCATFPGLKLHLAGCVAPPPVDREAGLP